MPGPTVAQSLLETPLQSSGTHRSVAIARRGRALQLAILALIAAVGIGWFCWFAARPASSSGDVSIHNHVEVREPATGAADPARAEPSERAAVDGPAPGGVEFGRSATLPRPIPAPFDDARLEGTGHIRGIVQAPAGIEFPIEWVLEVGPSSGLIGRERAQSRRLEFHAGETEFDLPDLPLGGYMLRASSFGLSTDAHHVLLAKPTETQLFVVMQLAPTAFVEGNVRFPDFVPAAGLELFLEPRPSGPRALAVTDVSGQFLFTDVHEGGYTLHFGRAENPVRPSIEVDVSRPSVRVPEAVVPALGELIVRVSSSPGVGVLDAKVEGYGDHGGRFDGVTGQDGEYRARFLPAGRITVSATLPDGRRVQGRVQLEVGVRGLIDLVAQP